MTSMSRRDCSTNDLGVTAERPRGGGTVTAMVDVAGVAARREAVARGLLREQPRALDCMGGHRSTAGVAAALLALVCAGCPADETEHAVWEKTFERLDGALLSVWGTAADDVITVGSDPGDGPLVLQYDGSGWSKLATGASGDLWWVTIHGDHAWMCGDGGTILRLDRTTGMFESFPPVTTERLYGIYAFADDDVWAVGGTPEDQTAVVLRFDGTAWSQVMLGAEITDALVFFKVFGNAPDDVWIVGLGGAAIHFDGNTYERIDVPLGRPLFTVHGNGDEILAVGGVESGHIVAADGKQLVNDTPSGVVPQFNGVWVEPDGHAVAAGIGGAVWQREDGQWAELDAPPKLLADLHSTYVDPDGGVWAVGGFILTEPLHDGVMMHYGPSIGQGAL